MSQPLSPEIRDAYISDLAADTFGNASNAELIRSVASWCGVFYGLSDQCLEFIWTQINPKHKTVVPNAPALPDPAPALSAANAQR